MRFVLMPTEKGYKPIEIDVPDDMIKTENEKFSKKMKSTALLSRKNEGSRRRKNRKKKVKLQK